ncbi:MAG: hypothetical protein JNK72_19360 [Myxococcales bacterium]|nr:hypothetical protein [Myxococcales bacterium]
MDAPRRPPFDAVVTVAEVISFEADLDGALAVLGAVHDARLALRDLSGHGVDLDALELHERALGLAIGAERARAYLLGRRGAPRRGQGRGL